MCLDTEGRGQRQFQPARPNQNYRPDTGLGIKVMLRQPFHFLSEI